MTITIERQRHYAYHGAMEQERRVGGWYETTVSIVVHSTKAAETDDLALTIDYSEVSRIIAREMQTPSNLIEHVAWRIANSVRRAFPQVTTVRAKVAKRNPPLGVDCDAATAEVEM